MKKWEENKGKKKCEFLDFISAHFYVCCIWTVLGPSFCGLAQTLDCVRVAPTYPSPLPALLLKLKRGCTFLMTVNACLARCPLTYRFNKVLIQGVCVYLCTSPESYAYTLPGYL